MSCIFSTQNKKLLKDRLEQEWVKTGEEKQTQNTVSKRKRGQLFSNN